MARIDAVCASLRERGLAQVAVVAVDDIAGGDTFSFAVELFGRWGVGGAESDNGLGILLVKDLREIRFVTGGGVEGVLPDALCKRIQLRYMLPAFREGNYDAGMVAGVEAAAQLLEGGDPDLGEEEGLSLGVILLIVAGFVFLPLAAGLAVHYLSRRCPRCRRFALQCDSQRVLGTTPSYREVEYTYVCRHCGAVVFPPVAWQRLRRRFGRRYDYRRRRLRRTGRRREPRRRFRRRIVRGRRRRIEVVTAVRGVFGIGKCIIR